jgi:hypothetical protein
MQIFIETPFRAQLDRFETAKGRPISNEQDLMEMTPQEIQSRSTAFDAKYPSAKPRPGTPTGLYNCHGRVFGAGRTGIAQTAAIRQILADEYVKIERAGTLAGDIVLYIAETGDIEHSAVLIEPGRESITRFDRVFSKWGNFLEFVHELHACPYDSTAVEYWRIDPSPRRP